MGESQSPMAHPGSPPRAPRLSPRDPTKRNARWNSQGASLTFPAEVETRDLLAPASSGAGPAWARQSWAPLLLLVQAAGQCPAPQPGFSRVQVRGDPPLCPSLHGGGNGPPPTQRCASAPAAGPRKLSSGPLPPLHGRGRACRRRASGVPAERRARLSAEDLRGGRQQGDAEDRASRGPHAQPPSGGPDGSLRGAHSGQQVRLRARAGEALQVGVQQ